MLAMTSENVGKGEVINIGSSRNISINELAKLFNREVEYLPERKEPKHTLADRSLAKKLLGWEPEVSFEDGVRELMNDFKIS
jgi:UDP-glucose 4-epimerase